MAAAGAVAAVAGTPPEFAVVSAAAGTYFTVRMTCLSPQVLRMSRGVDGTGPVGLMMGLSAPVAGVAPLVAGWLIPATGHAPLFAAVAVCCAAACLLLASVGDGESEPPTRSPQDIGETDG
jgi:peptidoglycan/LPS O-acetylase OafA/YrhL